MFNTTGTNNTTFTRPQQLDCIIVNQRYLNIRFTLLVTTTETGTTQEIRRSVVFLFNQNYDVRFVTRTKDEKPFSIKCEIQILPERAEGEHIYPCSYRKMNVPDEELKDFDKRSGWKSQPQVPQVPQPAVQPAQQQVRQQTAVPRQMQRIIPNMLQGEQQTIARRKVEEQLSMPTGELILGSDGSFFVRSRITNTILYEGTFSVYQPGTIVKFPNAARCTLSCQPIIYQPVYQPIYQPTNQPLQHTTTVYGNSQQPQMLQFGLPPNVQMIQPRVQQLPQQRQQQQQQQQQRHTRGVTENVIHIPQPQHVLPPAIHIPASLQQQIKQQSQTSRISPAVKITKPMEEEPTVKSPHEDIERGMSTGKHYQPISIDLSADDDDDRTVTAENSETEELPYGM